MNGKPSIIFFISPRYRLQATLVFAVSLSFGALIGWAPDNRSGMDKSPEIKQLDGEWVYVEDRTEGRTLEQLGPPMTAKFSFKVEDDVVILAAGHGSGHRNVRVALDGSVTVVQAEGSSTVALYTGGWKDGTFFYQTEFVRDPDTSPRSVIKKEFQLTDDGLIVRVRTSAAGAPSIALYQHPENIKMPTPFKATINDVSWLVGSWVGSRGTSGTTTIEERWGPALGGSMLGTNRTVTRDRMSAFEYLRIIERDGGLVYVAQPNGSAPTEFIMTELTPTRAVFDNPRHDYPKRITYELYGDGQLRATIGFMKGGSPRSFEFKRESTPE